MCLPADIRTALNKAMADSTKVANDVAFRTAQALEKVKAPGKTTIHTHRY